MVDLMRMREMGSCCHDKGCALDALRESQGRILRIVLAINVVLFLAELTAGISFADVSLGILAVAGLMVTLYVGWRAAKFVIAAVKGL